jgi:serine/threonine protein kinase
MSVMFHVATCNLFHEMEMTDHNLLASGNWRDTWLQQNSGDKTIVKTLKFEHTFQEQYYELSRVDALAMERLTSNPFVMDVHGFCGVSVMTARGHHELGFVVGKLQPRDKVIVSIQVALSIAAVHEIDGVGKPASLVHNDININNIFWGERGPLLNDFNIAVLMMKDKETNRRCKFPLHYPNPQWKSPEEQLSADGTSSKHLDEKVDVYALGNLLFRFATGTGPWREYAAAADVSLTPDQKDKIAYMKSVEGATPSIPKETLESKDRYIKTILEATKMCYRYDPKERPTARGVARFLQMSLDEIDAESE